MSFNRTFMELKYGRTDKKATDHGCFNRTFMELKLRRYETVLTAFVSFNRTFMELKYLSLRLRYLLVLF